MNIFKPISNVALFFLALGQWLFPEATSLSFNTRVVITLVIIVLITGRDLLQLLRNVNPVLQTKVKWLIEKMTHPLAKAIYIFILLTAIVYLVHFDSRIIYLSLASFFIYLTSAKWLLIKNVSFNDTFDSGLGSWKVVAGNPSVNDKISNPAPGLDLHVVQGQKTNCFLELLPIDTPKKGFIECDVFLESGSLFNIVFRADPTNERWYMARLETRGGSKDAFLKDSGTGWDFLKPADDNTSASTWHKMRIELNGSKAKLFRDDTKIAKMDDMSLKMVK